MSSHHIVREKQEPALLIINLDDFEEEHLGQILEWSPMIFVKEEMIDKVASLGIKIDIVLSAKAKNDFTFQEHIKVLNIEEAALKTGMDYLILDGFPSVNVITNNFIAVEYLDFISQIDLVVFENNKKIYPVKSGFNKWKIAGETIKFLNTADVKGLEIVGLKEIEKNLYETQSDGFFGLTFKGTHLFIAEEI
ncbi:MAG: thiamine pyrophosphokinase [Oligoflexus sp.]|nr:thiamine pyrophosphokinase [Pseudopedobacter sp.]